MKLFEQGMGYELHHILSKEEGEKLQRDAERKLGKQMNKVKKVEEAVVELEAISKLDNRSLHLPPPSVLLLLPSPVFPTELSSATFLSVCLQRIEESSDR
jgi:hypothetical protein